MVGVKTSNLVEVFNGVLNRVRFLLIQSLMRATFTWVNKYFVVGGEIARGRLAMKWTLRTRITRQQLTAGRAVLWDITDVLVRGIRKLRDLKVPVRVATMVLEHQHQGRSDLGKQRFIVILTF